MYADHDKLQEFRQVVGVLREVFIKKECTGMKNVLIPTGHFSAVLK